MENINPKANSKLYGLDHLRALAILLVLIFHYQLWFPHPAWTSWFMQLGWTGVDLFFVLSGFLISSQLFSQIKKGNQISIKEFYIKRFFRIIPIYFFVVAIYFLFPFFREKEALPPLWKFLTFTQNFGTDTSKFGTFSHVWSLCVEEHFYLFFPFILIFLLRKNLFAKSYWILIVLFLLGFALRFFLWNTYLASYGIAEQPKDYWVKIMYTPTYNRLDGLLVGVAIAALYHFLPNVWNKISKFGNHLIITGILLMAAAYFSCTTQKAFSTSIFGFPIIAIAYGFMVTGAISPVSFLYKWQSKTTTLIATLSYGIYLTHKSIIHVVQEIFSKWGIEISGNLIFLVSLVLCLLVALLLHLTIEKPFMKMRDKIIGQKIKHTANIGSFGVIGA